MYIERAIESSVLALSKKFRVLLVTGPRQCGKTTLLKKLAGSSRTYVTLDDLNERRLAKEDPALFVESHQPPVLIDEIQYAPEILSYIKIKVDNSDERGAYWLTGSQMFATMQGLTESLAGRIGVLPMQALSRSEIAGYSSEPFTTNQKRLSNRQNELPAADIKQVFTLLHRGFMPELIANDALTPSEYYSSYVATYIERDIRSLAQVADEMTFLRFLTAIAARTAKPLIMEEVARDVGISAPTAKRWVSILVSTGIVALVPAYHKSVLKRAVKMPLLHFLDMGLCAHILNWQTPDVLESGAMSGQFFESWVFAEIYKSYLNAGTQAPLYYYRDKQKHEIDLLIHNSGTLYPVEIKKTGSPGLNSIKNFKQLEVLETADDQNRIRIGEGAVVCMVDHIIPADKKNLFVPAWLV